MIHKQRAHPDDEPAKQDPGYVLRHRHGRTIKPLHPHHPAKQQEENDHTQSTINPAAELIRRKLETLYSNEPSAKQELAAQRPAPEPPRSKHQQFMYDLSTSGKSLAQIQTDWHNYYLHLPDDQKHQVWQEFYTANTQQPSSYTRFVEQQAGANQPAASSPPPGMPHPAAHHTVVADHSPEPTQTERRSVADIKRKIVKHVKASEHTRHKAKQHLMSLAVGIGTGALVLLILLFGFFNEVIIAPFIQPSRTTGETPIIVSSTAVAASTTPEVIIPKINVEIPTDYATASSDEDTFQKALESGVVHYPTTVLPGQQGNTALFGHSSNNIFNKGKYKFAFVLLHELVPGDVFYLTHNGTVYSYRVYDKKIVEPSEISVLSNVPGKVATATLITCDPPGTSLHRLVVWGEQISPDPGANAAVAAPAAGQPQQLTSNGPTLWSRLWQWVTNP
ncbi:MAG TPA: sortase [Nevskiaceae bacterium]|nr:sortase [Nevskiaceae bacterium]